MCGEIWFIDCAPYQRSYGELFFQNAIFVNIIGMVNLYFEHGFHFYVEF